ncbi:hypothetical protein JQN58_03115 [Aneurinibacillus sp. BA2021]|nr:hypothetical protein [Aneurinibacillus sp. BA2021]
MAEQVVAYRGICLSEAVEVIENQKYRAAEERTFCNDIEIKAVFGPGVYLVSDYTVAAEYAFCHAEARGDKGSVIRQSLCLQHPLRLDSCFGEKEIRSMAVAWKYPDGLAEAETMHMESMGFSRWAGSIIRDYVIWRGYDGIIYPIDDGLTYYIAYRPDEQIRAMEMDFVYDIWETRFHTFADLRNRYQAQPKESFLRE